MSRLFVYVPPISADLSAWEALKGRLAAEPESRGDVFYDWPFDKRDRLTIWTRGSLADCADRLQIQIASWANAPEPFEEIVLVGNSIGALVARAAWLEGTGASGRFEPQPWTRKVRRIVLIAGLSRGLATRLEPGRRNMKTLVFKLLVSVFSPIGFAWKDALAGSSFVTNLRLMWLRRMAELEQQDPNAIPSVAQVLGDRDGLVRREDSRDTEHFPGGAHVWIPGATHSTILDLTGPQSEERYKTLRSCILAAAPPTDPPPPARADATDVVFVVHGIRAGAFGWVTKMRERVAAAGPTWLVLPSSYRFFSALAFAFPMTRKRKVRWFLDQYTREVCRHPAASFHFIGHSNGTYILGRAMTDVQAVRFRRVYLAGSVLPADYPWTRLLDTGRIEAIRSDRGRRDMPVALLAQGLRGFGMRDVGAGGFEGFTELNQPNAIQWPYFPGGHGAPLATDERVANVASYITKGSAERPEGLIDDSGGALAVASRMSPLLLVAFTAALLIAITVALLNPTPLTVIVSVVAGLALLALAFV